MLHRRNLKNGCLVMGVLTLTLVGFDGLTYGNRCQPQTPSPCAADGTCRPIRGTFGYSVTRWRSWPGESMGQQPTAADSAGAGDEGGFQLPGKELPPPRREDLRGPAAKPKAKKSSDPAEEIPAELPAADIPGPAALPAFDPQGNNSLPVLPSMEDTPPALPASLRQAAHALQLPTLSTNRVTMPQSTQRATQRVTQRGIQSVRPAGWQQPTAISLINPASTLVSQPTANASRQAIYYEASDQAASTSAK